MDSFHPDELESDYTETETPPRPPLMTASPRHSGMVMRQIYSLLRQDTEAATEFRNTSPTISSVSLGIVVEEEKDSEQSFEFA